MLSPSSVKALFFDVFGTVVDWRTSVARESELVLKPKGYALDWLAFADAWRDEYQPSMDEVRNGAIPFSKLDVLHRRNLERILPRFKVTGLDEPTLAHLNRAWHRLDGWPDATPGLQRLHKKFLIAPVSNGHISLMTGIARRNDFPWDAILGAEIAGDYKPKPRVYLRVRRSLRLRTARMRDGGGAFRRPRRRRRDRAEDRACGAAERARPRQGRSRSRPCRSISRLRASSSWPRSSAHDRSPSSLTDRAPNCIGVLRRFGMFARTG